MPNKCASYGCSSGYNYESSEKRKEEAGESSEKGKISTFYFPLKNEELLQKWIKFVNRKDWIPTSSSVLCEKHFQENLIARSQRNKLKWHLNPIPTIHSESARKRPSMLPNVCQSRKKPKQRNVLPDEIQNFIDRDVILKFQDIDVQNHCPQGFQFCKTDKSIMFYRTEFNPETDFPFIAECIKIDTYLHVKLNYNGSFIPLPKWFTQGHNSKLTRYSMLENFPAYMRSIAAQHPYPILEELQKRQHYKPHGRPPYSAEVIRFALLSRYTSPQAYKQLLETFPLPSLSLLTKLQHGGIDSMKAAKMLFGQGLISEDIILMTDEMYLQKGTQFQGGEYIGANADGEMYKGIVVFMINGLQSTVPMVIRASPEVSLQGDWLAKNLLAVLQDLLHAGFRVRGLVADNHSVNVNAFKGLLNNNMGDKKHFFYIPGSSHKTYVFFDTVHLLKNIRNNLLNTKKFVFPAFEFEVCENVICSAAGYISWSDIHSIYDKDKKNDANLRKAHKLSYKALHPGNNKQAVDLAIAIFHESTVAASITYFPDRLDMAGFLKLVLVWWTIANSRQKFTPNVLSNGVTADDGKIHFYTRLADWIEEWGKSQHFCLTKATSNAFVLTLRSQAMLMSDLINEGYTYVLTRRFQSDRLENRFSQYRQMSGGRFLVGLCDVQNSERILACRSLLKAGINFWEHNDLTPNKFESDIMKEIEKYENEIMDLSLSSNTMEVACTIAGYVAKKILERTGCETCRPFMTGIGDTATNKDHQKFFNALSRGGYTAPSNEMLDFVSGAFAILDFVDQFITYPSVRYPAEQVLAKYAPKAVFTCRNHEQLGLKFAIRICVNIFYNNKQNIASDKVRKDSIISFKTRQRSKEQ